MAALTAVLFFGSLAIATTSAPAFGATPTTRSVSLVSQSTTVGATQSGISPFDVTLPGQAPNCESDDGRL